MWLASLTRRSDSDTQRRVCWPPRCIALCGKTSEHSFLCDRMRVYRLLCRTRRRPANIWLSIWSTTDSNIKVFNDNEQKCVCVCSIFINHKFLLSLEAREKIQIVSVAQLQYINVQRVEVHIERNVDLKLISEG